VREGYNHTQGTVVSERAAGYGHLAVGQTTAPPCGTTNLSLNAYPSRPGMQGAGVSLGLQQQQHPPSYSYGSSHMGVPLGTTALPPPAAFIPPSQPFQWPSGKSLGAALQAQFKLLISYTSNFLHVFGDVDI
jgi:hypothetical protein